MNKIIVAVVLGLMMTTLVSACPSNRFERWICNADVNEDGWINGHDTIPIYICWNQKVSDNPSCLAADVSGNGRVGWLDLRIVGYMGYYGQQTPEFCDSL